MLFYHFKSFHHLSLISLFILGVEYIIELRAEDETDIEKCSYICTICSMKLNVKTLVPHLRSVPHRLRYTVSLTSFIIVTN